VNYELMEKELLEGIVPPTPWLRVLHEHKLMREALEQELRCREPKTPEWWDIKQTLAKVSK